MRTITGLYADLKYTVLIVLFLFICSLVGQAQELPAKPRQLVNDYTGTLRAADVEALERKLLAFEDTTSTQIAVVLMRSTGEFSIHDYGVRLAQKWGVGQGSNNNGILLLAALDDREVTIQTGYGVEGAVPDVIAHRIIQNEIAPAFRQEDYYGGLDKATDALISYTKGEYKADPRRERKERENGGVPVVVIIIIVIVVISLISRNGGGGNRGGRVLTGRGSSDLFWWTLLNSLGKGGGGNGGGFGGGGFGGGSGGGFGGFGGGGFGGGGASGRW
ncbi:TPM domain-containing protein [Sphingobacterium bambusae]|uniref:TPM domain-containing protein n=1 Tax=Sphingobacterium bambusae TaxID=662858 RepID=A0ABW6BGQ8_9SPHI|nr:TPM domain-containing protein [Sphingobacterium bambusae]WPL50841.1 TPM domain-containing protein [Sphingobacterium bambusae]